MTPAPTVSVAMSVRNGRRFVRAAIDSVLSQTFGDFEFVIVDDASDDETWQILRDARDRDKRIRLVRNAENRGLSGAHNRGLCMCRGEFVARMDHDDVCEPTRLEKQVDLLRRRPDLAGCGTLRTEIDDDDRYRESPGGEPGTGEAAYLDWWMCLGNPIWHPTSVLRREWIERLGGYSRAAPYAEDFDLFSRLFRAGGRMEVVMERLLKYRRGEHNTTQLNRKDQRGDGEVPRRRHVAHLVGRDPADVPFRLMRQTLGWLETPDHAELAANLGPTLRLIGDCRRAIWPGANAAARAAMDDFAALHLLRRGGALLADHPRASLSVGRYVAGLPGHRAAGLRLCATAARCVAGRLRRAAI